jgi:transcription elongation factor GreA
LKGLFAFIINMTSIYTMAESKYYTREGLDKLREELNHLTNVERPSISKQIAEARDKGDLSENAEYDAAKNAQGMLEMKISKIQDEISNARIIDESKMDLKKVLILSTVKLVNLKNGSIMTYSLVPESEANLKLGKISVTSPIAKGLLGKIVGDKVEIDVPAGKLYFEIIEVSR